MWHNTRRGNNLIRKRYNTRRFKLNVTNICVIIATFFVVTLCVVGIYRLKDKENNKLDKIVETNSSVKIYNEDNNKERKSLEIVALGDMMMGGQVGEKLKYNYMSAFKNITEYTKSADYTMVNLTTNVIGLDKIEDAKSKYIVTKNIVNAFNALGIDGINLASDHMVDFSTDVFKETKNILKKDYDLIGLKNSIVYVENDGIKVAIIGVCNEVIGLESDYKEAGIMMYNLSKLKSMIKEANTKASNVIVMTHLGLENSHEVTEIMSWFYRTLIDYGADMILGSHALGVYPIEMYKNKPIIYSMGNIMSDTDYLIGKQSGIFKITIDEKGKMTNLTITPTYINAKKQTILMKDYDKDLTTTFVKYITKNLNSSMYKIKDNIVSIKFD